jgi:hypothetical protein
VDLYIGTPPKKFTLLLDTGSKYLWIRHQKLLAFARGNTFLPSKSSTWQQSRLHWGVKYLDETVAEGVEGIEKVRLGDVEADMLIGVADKLYEDKEGGRKGYIVGVKAGHEGYVGLDGILGIGMGSSFVEGLLGAGSRGIKLTFKEGKCTMEVLKDLEQEKGAVWYTVRTPVDESSWEITLKTIVYKEKSYSVPRNQRVSLL